jgi:hypothetical protein
MGRRRGLVVGAAVGAGVANRNAKNQAKSKKSTPAITSSQSNDDQMAQLEKLGQFRDQGILTEEVFTAKKKQIHGL